MKKVLGIIGLFILVFLGSSLYISKEDSTVSVHKAMTFEQLVNVPLNFISKQTSHFSCSLFQPAFAKIQDHESKSNPGECGCAGGKFAYSTLE